MISFSHTSAQKLISHILIVTFLAMPFSMMAQEPEGPLENAHDTHDHFPAPQPLDAGGDLPFDELSFELNFKAPAGSQYNIYADPPNLLFYNCNYAGSLTQDPTPSEFYEEYVSLSGSTEYEGADHYVTCTFKTTLVDEGEVGKDYSVIAEVTGPDGAVTTVTPRVSQIFAQTLPPSAPLEPILISPSPQTSDTKTATTKLIHKMDEWEAHEKYQAGTYKLAQYDFPIEAARKSTPKSTFESGSVNAYCTPAPGRKNWGCMQGGIAFHNITYNPPPFKRYVYSEKLADGSIRCTPTGAKVTIQGEEGPPVTVKAIVRSGKVKIDTLGKIFWTTFPSFRTATGGTLAYPRQDAILSALSARIYEHETQHFLDLKKAVEVELRIAYESTIEAKALGSLTGPFPLPSTEENCDSAMFTQVYKASRSIVGKDDDTHENDTIVGRTVKAFRLWDSYIMEYCMFWSEATPPSVSKCPAAGWQHTQFFGGLYGFALNQSFSLAGPWFIATRSK